MIHFSHWGNKKKLYITPSSLNLPSSRLERWSGRLIINPPNYLLCRQNLPFLDNNSQSPRKEANRQARDEGGVPSTQELHSGADTLLTGSINSNVIFNYNYVDML